jgi:diacylglycerol O-acyltransferase
MDRLSPLDSLFLHVEDGVTHMHIASCAVFERPPPPYQEFVDLVAAKLPLLPRYRQKVRFVPGQLGRPVWVDDPHFSLAYHVRHTALPPPGGEEELNNLMGRLMAVKLDRHRPLWETWMVEGLTGGRWALISKVHHCMVDGVAGTDLMVQLLDSSRRSEPPSPAPTWEPNVEPTDATLVVDAVSELLRTPAEQVRAARALMGRPRRVLRATLDFVQGATGLGRELRPAPTLSIDGAIGPHRRWATARGSLDEVKAIRQVFGGTVNDVVLAAITGAFRDLLLERGERVDVELRSLVPVSVRPADDHTPSNQVAMMIADLPVGIADPVERLTAIAARMASLKASHQAEASETMSSLARLTPPMLYALGLRSASAALRHVPLRSVHTVTTNVRGPGAPLYALGREMVEYLPFVPLSQGVRLGVAILSYNGQLRFGVTGDYDTVPEVPWFCSRIEACMTELGERARHIDTGSADQPLVG